jgi:hypothetical protein
MGRLLAALAAQSHPPVAVAVVDQSDQPRCSAYERVVADLSFSNTKVIVEPGAGGLSAGRNQAFRLLKEYSDWVVTPNDTSMFDPDYGELLCEAVAEFQDAGCIVGSYWQDDVRLRFAGERGKNLSGWDLWPPIEPACVWHLPRVTAVGGFDERLGAGATGRAQSGEGTDLLCRLSRVAPIVCAPELRTFGVAHDHGLGTRARIAKDRAYSIGTGVVYRRYFRGPQSWARLAWPIVVGTTAAIRGQGMGAVRGGWARSWGRTIGYFSPQRSVRGRNLINPSDRWRSTLQEAEEPVKPGTDLH